jgi:hypothetical protein
MAKTKQRYIRRIEGDVQAHVDVELGPRTLIVGRNATGKDSIVRTLSLALRGAVDDMAGRDNVKAAHVLSALAPGRTGTLKARALDNNGDVATFTMDVPEPGKTKGLTHKPLPGVLCPVVDLRENLLAGSEPRRRWLLGIIGTDMTEERIRALLPGPLLSEYTAVHTAVRVGLKGAMGADKLTPVELLTKVREDAARRQRTASGERKASLRIASAGGSNVPVPAASELETLKMEVDQATALLGQVPAVVQAAALVTLVSDYEVSQIPVLEAQVESSNAVAQQGRDQASAIQDWLYQNPEPSVEDVAGARQAITVQGALQTVAEAQIEAVTAGRITQCVLCNGGQEVQGTEIVLGANALAHAEHAIRSAAATIAQWQGVIDTVKVRATNTGYMNQWNATAIAADRTAEQATARVNDIRGRQQEQEAQRAHVRQQQTSGDDVALGSTRQAMEVALREVTEQYVRAKGAFDANANVRKAQSMASVAHMDEDKYKRLVEALDQVVGQVLHQAKDAFVQQVRGFMPEAENMPGAGRVGGGGMFEISLNEGKREVCDIGLLKQGENGGDPFVATSLSGAEEVIVRTAMACALGARSGSDLVVVTLNERGIHPDDLGPAMRALSKAPCQIIWTNTLPPKGRKPAGWTIIDTTSLVPPSDTFEADASMALVDTEAKAAAREASADAAEMAREEGADPRDVREAAKEAAAAAEAEVRGESVKASLPYWAQDIGRGMPTLALNGPVADTVEMAYPSAGGICESHRVTKGDEIVTVWHRFNNGQVCRTAPGRILMFSGRCIDPTSPTPPTVPVWAGSAEAHPQLFVVRGGPDALAAALLNYRLGEYKVRLSYLDWEQLENGLVVWKGGKALSVLSGTSGVSAAQVANAREQIGREAAGLEGSA